MNKIKSSLVLVIVCSCCLIHSCQASILGFGTTSLRVGSGGQYVVNLQTVLNNFEGDQLVVDGSFGLKTKLAVQAFQSKENLVPDGVVGNMTKQVLTTIQNGNVSNSLSLQSLTPSSAPVGTSVTIYGSGFSSTDKIMFEGSPVTVSSISTSPVAEDSISFNVPNSIGANCQGSVVCPMYARLVTPGIYSLSVVDANGVTSNTLQFTVTGTALFSQPTACVPIPITYISSGIPQTTTGLPILEVTSPTTGTTYHQGDTITITWSNCGTYSGNVGIMLVGEGQNQGQNITLASNIPITSLGYQYTIPVNYTPPPYSMRPDIVGPSGQYTVLISDGRVGDSNADQGSSGTFTILPQ